MTNNYTIFHAIWDNDISFVKNYIASGQDINVRNEHESTLLIFASCWKRTVSAELLKQAGADLEAINDGGYNYKVYEEAAKNVDGNLLR